MAGAFLKYGNKLLLINKSLQKKLNPGKFAPIGGHLKPEEFNAPARACLREITEETGIEACDIVNFQLCFITVWNNGGKTFIFYIFIYNITRKNKFLKCNEETLHWIDYDISFYVK